MIGRINNVNSLNYLNSANNNVSFGKKKAYTTTTTTTVSEGKTKEKTGFFKKIGLAIVGTIGAIFAIGKLSEMKDKKGVDNNKPADNKPNAPVAADETAPAKEAVNEAPVEAVETAEVPNEETIADETPVVADEVEEAPVEEAVADEAPIEEAEVIEDEAPVEEAEVAEVPNEETIADETPVAADEVEEAPVEETVVDEAPIEEAEVVEEEAPIEETVVTEVPENKGKKQAQALLTAGMAGAAVAALPEAKNTKEVSAAQYADAQKAQLGAINVTVKKPEAKIESPKNAPNKEIEILEDAFDVSLNGEKTAEELKATLKEFRQYVKEANKNDFEDIVAEDGGVVAFEKHVEYPEGETTGIIDEAITKHTREQEKQEILTATKLDAQGNLEGVATYINGRIDSLTKMAPNGEVTTIQADDKGVLVAKGMKQTEAGVAFDEILNFEYVGDDRKLVSCAKGVKIENGVTDIEKAYKYDDDNNLKEFAVQVAIGPENKGILGNNYQFESDNMVAAASLYNGDISGLGKGMAAEVYTFENGEPVSHDKNCEYKVNI